MKDFNWTINKISLYYYEITGKGFYIGTSKKCTLRLTITSWAFKRGDINYFSIKAFELRDKLRKESKEHQKIWYYNI